MNKLTLYDKLLLRLIGKRSVMVNMKVTGTPPKDSALVATNVGGSAIVTPMYANGFVVGCHFKPPGGTVTNVTVCRAGTDPSLVRDDWGWDCEVD